MIIKSLVLGTTFSLLSITAAVSSAATVNYVYGNSAPIAGTYVANSIFANLSVTTSNNIDYTFVLKTFNLDAFNTGAFIGSVAVDTNFANGEKFPSASLTGSNNGVNGISVTKANGPKAIYDFRYKLDGGNNKLNSDESVSWTTKFAVAHTFDAGLFALHLQGLTKGQGDSDWYTPNLSPVPVPAALPLMASALGLFGIAAKRRKQKLN